VGIGKSNQIARERETCSRFSSEEHDGAIMGRIIKPKYMKVRSSPARSGFMVRV
jgi:hypothetical protein